MRRVYHFQGERYFGCTKTGKFQCEHDAVREGVGPRAMGMGSCRTVGAARTVARAHSPGNWSTACRKMRPAAPGTHPRQPLGVAQCCLIPHRSFLSKC